MNDDVLVKNYKLLFKESLKLSQRQMNTFLDFFVKKDGLGGARKRGIKTQMCGIHF
jgi:hypothetical protein